MAFRDVREGALSKNKFMSRDHVVDDFCSSSELRKSRFLGLYRIGFLLLYLFFATHILVRLFHLAPLPPHRLLLLHPPGPPCLPRPPLLPSRVGWPCPLLLLGSPSSEAPAGWPPRLELPPAGRPHPVDALLRGALSERVYRGVLPAEAVLPPATNHPLLQGECLSSLRSTPTLSSTATYERPGRRASPPPTPPM